MYEICSWKRNFNKQDIICQLIIDCQKLVVTGLLPKNDDLIYDIETASKVPGYVLCHAIHTSRKTKLQLCRIKTVMDGSLCVTSATSLFIYVTVYQTIRNLLIGALVLDFIISSHFLFLPVTACDTTRTKPEYR